MDKLAKTISIHAICEMELINNNKKSSFDYNIDLDLDGTGQIILTPLDPNTTFRDVYLISTFDDTDMQNDYSRTFAINIVANMELIDTQDDDYQIDLDDLGQVVITPYAALDGVAGDAKFVSFEIEKDSSLVTEDIDDIQSDPADSIQDSGDSDTPDIEARVIDESAYSDSEIEEMLIDITDNWSEAHGQIETQFIEEYKRALDILEKHYDRVEALGEHDGRYLIEYQDAKETRLTEGTLELPFDRESAREFDRFMAEPQPKKTALNKLKAIFFDDILLDQIYDLGDEVDIRETVKNRLLDILDSYDKDKSDFKIELDSNTRRILNNILDKNYSSNNLTEDVGDEEEPAWEITYDLPIMEAVDTDEIESADNKEIIHAPDAETAIKYAEQNARIKAKEDDKWLEAEIIGVQKQ